jgi:hypothetical protein
VREFEREKAAALASGDAGDVPPSMLIKWPQACVPLVHTYTSAEGMVYEAVERAEAPTMTPPYPLTLAPRVLQGANALLAQASAMEAGGDVEADTVHRVTRSGHSHRRV